jgi:tetratricopeptide (TPR) repeat protein
MWMARLDLEAENILVAHAWCDHAPGGAEMGFKLSRGIKTYAINRGLLTVGHRVISEVLARPRASARNELRSRALFDVGQFAFFMGRYMEAQRHLDESLAIARELDNKMRVGAALQPLGMAYLGLGMIEEARRTLEEALALAREIGEKREIGAALTSLGSFQRSQGALDAAEQLYLVSIEALSEVGDLFSCGLVTLNLAMLAILRGQRPKARSLLLEAMAASESLGQQRLGLATIEVCSGFAAACGEYERATRFYGVAEAQNSSTGLHRDPADDSFLAPLIAKAREELGPRYRAVEDIGRALDYAQAISEARAWLLQ